MQNKTNIKPKKRMEKEDYSGVRNGVYRELILLTLDNKPQITSIEALEDEEGVFNGSISFAVRLDDIGLSVSNIYQYRQEISSDFYVSFLGEILVRENLNEFMDVLSDLNSTQYLNSFSKKHERFGMRIDKSTSIVLTFHVSLLKSLVAEEFNFQLNK